MKQLYDFQLKTNKSFQEAQKNFIENPQENWGEIASTFKWYESWDEVYRREIEYYRKLSRPSCGNPSRERSLNLGTK